MLKSFQLSLLSGLFVFSLSQPCYGSLVTTFDSGLEGWTGTGGSVTFQASGGNPSGYLRQEDTEDDWMTVFAPDSFHGDLSEYLNGTLSFDALNGNDAAPDLVSPPLFGTVDIVGSSDTASLTLGGTGEPPDDSQWHHYSAPLTESDWSGDLSAALSDVTSISVVLESNSVGGGEINGFDNFSIQSQGVPEPSSGLLMGFAAAAGCFRHWRRRRRSNHR